MAGTVERTQLDVWEVRTDDGGVGVEVAGVVYMGWDAQDVEHALELVLSRAVELEPADDTEV